MSKKHPVKPIASNTKPSNTTANKKYNSNSTAFQLSNKILIPAILLLFLALAFIYCKPLVDGLRLSTHDSNQYLAMSKEGTDFKDATGHTPLWSSRMFGGMPAYLMGGFEYSKFLNFLPRTIIYKIIAYIPNPAMGIFFLLVSSFIGLYVLIRKPLFAFTGAIAIGFCTANFISLDAGHITKVNTIAMFLPMFAGIWLLYEKQYIWGLILSITFVNESIGGGHVQITYYSLLIIGIYMLIKTIQGVLKSEIKHVITAGFLFVGVLVIVGMMNFYNYFVNDFSKETTRGSTILNAAKMNPSADNNKKAATVENEKGVGFDYATNWSFGFEELGALIVPNHTGAVNIKSLEELPNFYNAVVSNQVNINPALQSGAFTLYWGSEPFVQGPIYLGVIVVFLFFFGLFAYKGNLKWWIVGSIVFTILIAFGKNFEPFYRLLYNIVPMFNKFRAPTMIFALTQMLMVLLGILGLMDFFDDKVSDKTSRLKSLKFSTGIMGSFLVLILLFGGFSSFHSKNMDQGKSKDDFLKEAIAQANPTNPTVANTVVNALVSDRKELSRADAIRSLILVLLVAGLLFAFAFNKFKQQSIILSVLSVLILIDFWMVSKRYLNESDFEEKTALVMNTFPETPADLAILSQNKTGARMADFSGDIFNSANPAYYHRTIGGYSPAKLRRYQDIVEFGLSYDFQLINKGGFASANYMNMLNTKYIKQAPEANSVIQNQYALGNAWFVNNLEKVNSPEEEILKVRDINPAKTAIIHKEFNSYLNEFSPNSDSSAQNENRYIAQVDTKDPMKLEYKFKSPNKEFVVFSEVIYRPNEDWISYIDGKQADHIRVNYILRGMKVDAGEHKITFEFKPKLFAIANNIIVLGNALFYLVIGVLLFLFYKKKKQKAEHQVA